MVDLDNADECPWVTDVISGHGHRGSIRNGVRQAVCPRWSDTWDVFENGRCIETGLSEQEARAVISR